ncbi:helix-turn-helix transcriptional regulator [Sphingomonas aracearum]|uniref:Helix-turn-helix transcriptional regulator n=2 Tax=Sphingomonas aracearum TaxID=2283317 RepID=A0A369VWU6_9SPHN|nr:helix-turn-helix transcriptional regulator [Sphingomonas aracearum]
MAGITSNPVVTLVPPAKVPASLPPIARDRLVSRPEQQALQALSAVMQASGITILSRSVQDGTLETITSSSDEAEGEETLLSADEHGFVALRELRWFDRGHETAALVKLIERREFDVWAVLSFAVPIGSIRSALIVQMPAFVSMLAAHAAMLMDLAEERTRARAVAAALDQQDGAVFVLRRDHTVLFANRSAHLLLERKAGLQLSRAKLRPLGYKEAVRFETAVDCVVDAAHAGPSAARSAAMLLLLPVSGGERRLAVTIAPVDRGAPGMLPDKAAAIVCVQPDGEQLNHGVEAICQAYALSPVEVQLVCHLAAGLSVADTASRMKVKIDTARAYLKQVFAKTGTNRQASLLQLIVRHQGVIQGDHLFSAA